MTILLRPFWCGATGLFTNASLRQSFEILFPKVVQIPQKSDLQYGSASGFGDGGFNNQTAILPQKPIIFFAPSRRTTIIITVVIVVVIFGVCCRGWDPMGCVRFDILKVQGILMTSVRICTGYATKEVGKLDVFQSNKGTLPVRYFESHNQSFALMSHAQEYLPRQGSGHVIIDIFQNEKFRSSFSYRTQTIHCGHRRTFVKDKNGIF